MQPKLLFRALYFHHRYTSDQIKAQGYHRLKAQQRLQYQKQQLLLDLQKSHTRNQLFQWTKRLWLVRFHPIHRVRLVRQTFRLTLGIQNTIRLEVTPPYSHSKTNRR